MNRSPTVPAASGSPSPPLSPPRPTVRGALEGAAEALRVLAADRAAVDAVEGLCELIAERLRLGHKVMACGNGGSACDAMHFVEELTGRFRNDRPALAAIACTDVGHITCTANDYGFEQVFSRWVEALGREGDVLVLLSTSGNSPNVLRAAAAGRELGMTVVGMLGKDGGRLGVCGDCHRTIVVPGVGSDRIQELHMLILHAVVEGVERILFSR